MSWWWAVVWFVIGDILGFIACAVLTAAANEQRERELAAARARVGELERTAEYYRAVAEDARRQFNHVAASAEALARQNADLRRRLGRVTKATR